MIFHLLHPFRRLIHLFMILRTEFWLFCAAGGTLQYILNYHEAGRQLYGKCGMHETHVAPQPSSYFVIGRCFYKIPVQESTFILFIRL